MLKKRWYWLLLFFISMSMGVAAQLSMLYNFFFYNQVVVEGVTTAFLVIVAICVFFFRKSKRADPFLYIAKSVSIGFLLVYLLGLAGFLMHDRDVRELIVKRTSYFQNREEVFLPLVTSLTDKAEKVNVRSDIDKMYNAEFGYKQEDGSYKGRSPIYFIRLKDGKLQKLFQSGGIKNEVTDTDGERKVVEMLQGRRSTSEFPQYTCCGGDDFYEDAPFLRHFLPERRYLKDFPSELEVIIPIHDEKGNIKGALVSLHGD